MVVIIVLLLIVLLGWSTVSFLRRHGGTIVAQRGTSTGADFNAMLDRPRVWVQAVTTVGPDRVRLVLTPITDAVDTGSVLDLEFVVCLDESEFGFEILCDWQRSATAIAMVIPPNSRILRLRSISDLQPLTLRRADDPTAPPN